MFISVYGFQRMCASGRLKLWHPARMLRNDCAVSATVGSVTFGGRLCFSASARANKKKKKSDCIYRQQIARRVNDENNKAHYGCFSTCLTRFFFGLFFFCCFFSKWLSGYVHEGKWRWSPARTERECWGNEPWSEV